MKILHITYWYPNKRNPHDALWIQRHIQSIEAYCEQSILHLEVKKGEKWMLHQSASDISQTCMLTTPVKSWYIIELLQTLLFLRFVVINGRWKKYNILNIHIAYPLLTYWHWIKKIVKKPVVITEHWSAYHYNFGVKKNLPRAQRIFQQQLPVIVVSKALGEDIKNFSTARELNTHVVPNIVDTSVFKWQERSSSNSLKTTFFMLSQWKSPKDPFTIIKAFAAYCQGKNTELRIGGYGNLLDDMQRLVRELHLEEKVTWLGRMEKKDIAKEFQNSSAFLHASDYETFSVVCAESVCCGCPVIASNVGGIPEFIDQNNGILLDDLATSSWIQALCDIERKNIPSPSNQSSCR